VAGESARESARRQREKAERLLRAAELHERGAQGEETTAIALGTLPAEYWTVLHDLRWPGRRYANVDHVVIGPPGVFVIDSKNWAGRISVHDGVLRCNGYRKEREVAGAAEAALAVARLTTVVGPDLVHPVLCFIRDEEVVGRARDVWLCSTRNIIGMLESRPARLTPNQVRDVSLQLDAQLSPATGAPSTPIRNAGRPPTVARAAVRAPRRPPARRASSRQRRRKKQSAPRLVLALALIAVLIFAPELVMGVAAALGQALAQLMVNQ
jgi:hypothetical protein